MYLIYDTETGGLGRDVSLLTAWFGVFNKEFELIDELDLKLIPDDGIYRVQPEGLAINKIDLVQLGNEAVPYKEAKTLIYNFLQDSYKTIGDKLIPIGQNVAFDREAIVGTLISVGSWEQFVSYREIDTMIISRFLQLAGKLESNSTSLKALIEFFGVKVEGTLHEARYDALATAKVYQKLLELVK